MKKQIDLQLFAIFGGGLLFNLLFWNEELGINLLLHTLFILLTLCTDRNKLADKKVIFFGAANLFAAICVVYNNAVLNIIGYYFSLLIFIGYAHAHLLKTVFAAGISGFLQILSSPINLVKKIITVKIGKHSLKPFLRPLKYVLIPFIILFFFTIIYSVANPVFGSYVDELGNFIERTFAFIFKDLAFDRIIHIVLGVFFTAGLLLSFKENGLEKIEGALTESLVRKRRQRNNTTFAYEVKSIFFGAAISKKMALKTENIIGIISLFALNLLLLLLNSIDINTLWLGNAVDVANKNYSAELHDGTNALIFSIVMAMMVIIYFFSGNLNFFSRNKFLKTLAYIWIAQNAFLVCSVLLRDYNYIAMHGLTYKRIGVLVFLSLCTAGLATVYLKVAKQKTLFYLVKTNGFLWYVILLSFGIVNWDVLIVNYNIDNRKSITLDVDHIMDFSAKTLPILDKNRAILAEYASNSHYYDVIDTVTETIDTTSTKASVAEPAIIGKVTANIPIDSVKLEAERKLNAVKNFNERLDARIGRYKEGQAQLSWLSWNYRDWKVEQYFKLNK
ncbi:MAG: DUF4173 domain-containing protein [Pedobacter sp.]|nr:MAG: DUF4173 domain-containing protein [Pedobacter sp.]